MSPVITSRQADLLRWMRERSQHDGLTAPEIIDVIGYPYSGLQGRYDKCLADLKQLQAQGLVVRCGGRPARWIVETTP